VQATSGEFKGGLFALKGLHKCSDEAGLERFFEECEFLKTNTHPNLMRLVDEGQYYGQPFVVQPYMPHTLRQELRRGALPFGKALSFACQLLSAVQVFFCLIKKASDTPDDEDKEYKACAYYYRTPELVAYAKGEKGSDLRSDIFQLGLVIAEMFSGRNPLLQAEEFTDELKLDPVSPIKGRHAGLVFMVINAMLAANPDNRTSIERCLDAFTGIFELYAQSCQELHEEVILE